MTINERNKIPDTDRIKRFIENTMRNTCDELSDLKDDMQLSMVLTSSMHILKELSEIYHNMGFDKEKQNG